MFSAGQLIIQKQKLDFLITKSCRDQVEEAVLIMSSYYRVSHQYVDNFRLNLEILKTTHCVGQGTKRGRRKF